MATKQLLILSTSENQFRDACYRRELDPKDTRKVRRILSDHELMGRGADQTLVVLPWIGQTENSSHRRYAKVAVVAAQLGMTIDRQSK